MEVLSNIDRGEVNDSKALLQIAQARGLLGHVRDLADRLIERGA